MSPGELIRLAREISEDGALVYVSHMNSYQQFRLVVMLTEMLAAREITASALVVPASRAL